MYKKESSSLQIKGCDCSKKATSFPSGNMKLEGR